MVDSLVPFSSEGLKSESSLTFNSVVDAPKNFLSFAGTNVSLVGMSATNKLSISYSSSEGTYLESFKAPIPNAWAGIPLNSIQYLAKDFGGAFSAHVSPPTHGNYYQRERNSLMHFNNNILDDYGNTWVHYTAGVASAPTFTATSKFGGSAIQLNGVNQFLECPDIKRFLWGHYDNNGFEVEFWFNLPALPALNTFFPLLSMGNSNTGGNGVTASGILLFAHNTATAPAGTKLALAASSNPTNPVWDIASVVTGNVAFAINTWYRCRLVYDSFNATMKLYLSVNGALETLQWSGAVTYYPMVTGMNLWLGRYTTIYANVIFDEFRFSSFIRDSGAVTPPIVPYTVDGHHYDKNNKVMLQVTGASTVAGTDPIFTEVERVFIGKAITNGVGIVEIDQYQLNNRFTDSFCVTGSGVTTGNTLTPAAGANKIGNLQAISVCAGTDITPHPTIKDAFIINTSGLYYVSSQTYGYTGVSVNATSFGGYRVNGGFVYWNTYVQTAVSAGQYGWSQGSDIRYFSAGTYIELVAYSTGVAGSVVYPNQDYCFLHINRID